MKKSHTLIAICVLAIGSLNYSCSSPQQNVDDAEVNLKEAKASLAEAIRDSVQDADWQEFKQESQRRIAANNARILELQALQNVKKSKWNPALANEVNALNQKNVRMQQRIEDYEKYHSNWSEFKREFNHDMEELSKSLKDIAGDNSK